MMCEFFFEIPYGGYFALRAQDSVDDMSERMTAKR